jgi:hypothetical protein
MFSQIIQIARAYKDTLRHRILNEEECSTIVALVDEAVEHQRSLRRLRIPRLSADLLQTVAQFAQNRPAEIAALCGSASTYSLVFDSVHRISRANYYHRISILSDVRWIHQTIVEFYNKSDVSMGCVIFSANRDALACDNRLSPTTLHMDREDGDVVIHQVVDSSFPKSFHIDTMISIRYDYLCVARAVERRRFRSGYNFPHQTVRLNIMDDNTIWWVDRQPIKIMDTRSMKIA